MTAPAAWLATKTRDSHGAVRANANLAVALETRWTHVQAAFAAGAVNLAQVRVIDKALTDLPQDLGDDLIANAETYLLTEAAHLGPRELAIMGDRVLEYLAPDIAEAADYQRLLDQERRAAAVTRLTLRRRGDGSTDLHARIPELTASLLRTFLAAFTAPRRHHGRQGETVETPFGPLTAPIEDEFANLPIARQQGIGFLALLERVLKSDLPRHGGKATSLVVLINHDTLVADVTAAGIAHLGRTVGHPKRPGVASSCGDGGGADGRQHRDGGARWRLRLDHADAATPPSRSHLHASRFHGWQERQPD